MVALNTEPLDSCHLHIGELQMFSLGVGAGVPPAPLWTYTFHPVPLAEGRFFNQCIQKKGTSELGIRMFLGLPDPHPDPLVTNTDPDPSII
jgi:hypothetical protein